MLSKFPKRRPELHVLLLGLGLTLHKSNEPREHTNIKTFLKRVGCLTVTLDFEQFKKKHYCTSNDTFKNNL